MRRASEWGQAARPKLEISGWESGSCTTRSANAMLAVSPKRDSSRWSDTGCALHPRETPSSASIDGFVRVYRPNGRHSGQLVSGEPGAVQFHRGERAEPRW
jgi:hypothetical protein